MDFKILTFCTFAEAKYSVLVLSALSTMASYWITVLKVPVAKTSQVLCSSVCIINMHDSSMKRFIHNPSTILPFAVLLQPRWQTP